MGVNKTVAVEEMDRVHLGIQQRQLGIYNQGTERGGGGGAGMDRCDPETPALRPLLPRRPSGVSAEGGPKAVHQRWGWEMNLADIK